MKSLKIYQYSIIILAALGLFASCEKALNEQPVSELSDDQFWKNNADAEAGVTAIYDAMQKHYKERQFLWGEFRADNFVASPTATGTSLELLSNTLTAANSGVVRWNELYRMIGRANLAIEKIPTIVGYDKNLLAEAYLARAYAYFDAVRVWGGVPLFKEAIKGLDQDLQRPRTDAQIIMNEVVIPDMLEAEKLMARTQNTYRFSKMSIYAFQGTVYMFQKDYVKAKAALDKIATSKLYTLTTTRDAWQKTFLNDINLGGKFMTSPELIFSLKYSLIEDADRSGIYNIFFAGLPSYFIAPSLENKWIEKFPIDSVKWVAKYPLAADLPKTKNADGVTTLWGDWRYFDSKEAGKLIGGARLAKYNKANYNGTFDDSDIHIYRYANILLMLAEAENQIWKSTNTAANKTAAVALVNQIRVARQLPQVKATDFTTADQLEDFILDERQMELLGEGQRWWDLVRTGKVVKVMGPINGQSAQKIVFPIFQSHLIENPKLVQNEGY